MFIYIYEHEALIHGNKFLLTVTTGIHYNLRIFMFWAPGQQFLDSRRKTLK